MAITTKSSIKVKPPRGRGFAVEDMDYSPWSGVLILAARLPDSTNSRPDPVRDFLKEVRSKENRRACGGPPGLSLTGWFSG
jgi:hypothetical protein